MRKACLAQILGILALVLSGCSDSLEEAETRRIAPEPERASTAPLLKPATESEGGGGSVQTASFGFSKTHVGGSVGKLTGTTASYRLTGGVGSGL
jgi:hypothetical protein